MRLLRNIIKASEYVTIKNSTAFPSNNKNLQNNNENNSNKSVINEAFDKAKQIMDAAEEFSIKKVQESTEKMNEESAKILRHSREDGFAKGFIKGKEEGIKAGYKDGYEDGFNKAQKKNQEVLNELTEMIKSVQDMKSEVIGKYEADIKKLSLEIAEKVIKRELSIDEKAMQSIILNSMDAYSNEEWIKIIVSPNTKSALINSDISIAEELKGVSNNIRIEASPDMKDGDCTIDMPDRMIDSGVDTQLSNIKRELEV